MSFIHSWNPEIVGFCVSEFRETHTDDKPVTNLKKIVLLCKTDNKIFCLDLCACQYIFKTCTCLRPILSYI